MNTRLRNLSGLVLLLISFGLHAQEEAKPFVGLSMHSGIIHSQLTIWNNGAHVGYGFLTGEKSLWFVDAGFAYGFTPDQDHRDCRAANYSVALNGMLPVYHLIAKRFSLQFYGLASVAYDMSRVKSYIDKQFLEKSRMTYPVARFGGAVAIPLSKSWYATMPFLHKSRILVSLAETAAFTNNVSSFYREYSRISFVTWGQEIRFTFQYAF